MSPERHRLAWSVELGAGVDDVDYEGKERPERELGQVRSGSAWRPMAHALARGTLLLGATELGLGVTTAMPLVDAHYDVMLEGEPRREITLWAVQPGLLVEAAWD